MFLVSVFFFSACGGGDGGSAPSGSTTRSFIEHNINTSADGATSVYAIDVDGDNDIDVVSALAGGDRVVWYEKL